MKLSKQVPYDRQEPRDKQAPEKKQAPRRKEKLRASSVHNSEALGLFLFDDVTEALAAERVLKSAGYALSLVAPPYELRQGCDLAVALPSVEYPGAARVLNEAGVAIRDWVSSASGAAGLCDLVTTVDFGQWLMVRSGNMKITVEKPTGVIVNTSGGGCPDIPYLNLELVGKTLANSSRPKDLGYTLCSMMLDRAYREACELLGIPSKSDMSDVSVMPSTLLADTAECVPEPEAAQ